MKQVITILGFLYFVFGFSGCDDDPVMQPPEISFFRVINSGTYYALDTLKFDLFVQSDQTIKSLKMSLKSDQGTVILSQVWSQINSHEISLYDEVFILSRKNLETDTYNLEAFVYAMDGTAKESMEVDITALAPDVERVLLVYHNNDLTTMVGCIDHDLVLSEMFALSGDFLDAYADSDDEVLFTAGSISGNLICSDLNTFEEVWHYGVDTNPPFPKFRAAVSSDNHIWVSRHSDYILGFDNNGTEKVRAWLSSDRYPESMIIADKYIVAEEYSKTTTKKTLTSWYNPSGVLVESRETFADDLILIDFRDDELFYVEIHDGISSFYALDLDFNNSRWLFDYQEVMHLACPGPQGSYFLTSGSALYAFFPDYTLEFRQSFDQPIESMTYDFVNSILYLIAGNTLYKYSAAQNIIEKTNTFDASPDKVVIQYNRNLFTSEMY